MTVDLLQIIVQISGLDLLANKGKTRHLLGSFFHPHCNLTCFIEKFKAQTKSTIKTAKSKTTHFSTRQMREVQIIF